jgi:hypothetical protein
MASLPGELADEKSSCWSRLESMRKMGKSGTEREAAEVMVAELTGVRSVRNDIQIRDLEQQ